jgi:hypothetical protein
MDTGKIFVIIFYLLCVYIFVKTYLYLDEIDKCPCFHKDGKYAVSIDFMKFFQILEIVILTASLATMFFVKSNNKVDLKNTKGKPSFVLILTMIIMLTISALMAYNVINMYTNIKEDCKCVDSWYRYFVYYEGFVSLMTVFRFVVIFLLFGIFFIMSKVK